MNDSDRFSRRAIVRLAGSAVPTAALAGCLDENRGADGPDQSVASESDAGAQNGTNSNDGAENRTESAHDGGTDAEDGADGESDADAADENGAESDSAETDAASDSDERSDDSDSETRSDDPESSDDAPSVEIEPGTDVRLSAMTNRWEGLEPSAIEGAENPTLVLEAGEQYTIGWTDGDGAAHNLEIRDEDGAVVDDLSTEITTEPDDDQILEFTASEELDHYCCDPHRNTMIGTLRIE